MKPKFHITNLCALAIIVLGALFHFGCTKEGNTNCGIAIQFKYIKNVDNIDKFGSSVSRIDLYIYDEAGKFLKTYNVQSSQLPGGGAYLPKDYTMTLRDIQPGTYTLVAWGNYSTTHVSYKDATPSYDNALLNLNITPTDRSPHTENFTLFWSNKERLIVAKDYKGTQLVTMEMTKFTNEIEFIATGLLVNPDNPSSIPFHSYITSKNGSYRFNGSYADDKRVTYDPYYVSPNDATTITSKFNILRELNSKLSDPRLIVTYDNSDGTTREIANEPLADILIAIAHNNDNLKNTGNLDVDDVFVIRSHFDFDLTAGTVTITIQNWTNVTNPIPLR